MVKIGNFFLPVLLIHCKLYVTIVLASISSNFLREGYIMPYDIKPRKAVFPIKGNEEVIAELKGDSRYSIYPDSGYIVFNDIPYSEQICSANTCGSIG